MCAASRRIMTNGKRAVLRAGVDVARINFSHGSAEEHAGRIARFRNAARRVGKFAADNRQGVGG